MTTQINGASYDVASFLSALLAETTDDLILTDLNYRVLAAGGRGILPQTGEEYRPAVNSPVTIRPVKNPKGVKIGYLIYPNRKNATVDLLTGIADRRRLEAEYARLSFVRDQTSEPLALIFLDLDDFKPVNDSYGHWVGDQILMQFACLLRNEFRASDLAARYGGDEFVILCPDCPLETARRRIQQFLDRLSHLRIEARLSGTNEEPVLIPIGFSFGVIATEPEEAFDAAIRRADAELYRMKEARSA